MQTTPQAGFKTFILPTKCRDTQAKVFLLFSKSQIVEVLREVTIHPVPFCADYISGGAPYNQRLLPVVFPEKVLGFAVDDLSTDYRQYIVVRSGAIDPQLGTNLQVILAARGKLVQPKAETEQHIGRMRSVGLPEVIPDPTMVRAVFQQGDSYFVVVDLSKLVLGEA